MQHKNKRYIDVRKTHLRFLATIAKKLLMKEFCRWKVNSSAKGFEFKVFKQMEVRNRENLRANLRKVNSMAFNNISTIIESGQELSPSPSPISDIFEELKTSLNSKVGHISKISTATGPRDKGIVIQTTSTKSLKKAQNSSAIVHSSSFSKSTKSIPMIKKVKVLSKGIFQHSGK
ncbi:hypothetical protein SteCoe_24206 [Stentor coeruleus]|uniref:Uncharacterized protein n=1 Tax=Stentor coeruleus TaxID=5963 RepID=A0A1R2BI23_9CILI|nr:hypothetical protein SteCoe_24206 [Stentor coeruleus]